MKRLSIILAVAIAFMTGSIYAQTSANALVKKTIDKLNSHKNIEISFDYQVSNGDAGLSKKDTGKAIMQGDAYRLEIADQQISSDGKTLWTYLVDNKEVMVSDASNDDNIMTPIKLISTYDKNYKMRFVNTKEKGVKAVEMTNAIKGAEIYDVNGSKYIVTITKTVTDKKLGSKTFSFDTAAHPDVEVID